MPLNKEIKPNHQTGTFLSNLVLRSFWFAAQSGSDDPPPQKKMVSIFTSFCTKFTHAFTDILESNLPRISDSKTFQCYRKETCAG